MTKEELINEWYYKAEKDHKNGIISNDLWEEIKWTIDIWKAAQIDHKKTKK